MTARLLTASEAAIYLCLPLATVTRLGVGRVRLGSSVRYDRKAIDAYLDDLGGLRPNSGEASAKTQSEAALERFSERFNAAARRP